MNNISLLAYFQKYIYILLPRPLFATACAPHMLTDPLISQSASDRNALSDCYVNGIWSNSQAHTRAHIANNLINREGRQLAGDYIFGAVYMQSNAVVDWEKRPENHYIRSI